MRVRVIGLMVVWAGLAALLLCAAHLSEDQIKVLAEAAK